MKCLYCKSATREVELDPTPTFNRKRQRVHRYQCVDKLLCEIDQIQQGLARLEEMKVLTASNLAHLSSSIADETRVLREKRSQLQDRESNQ